MMTAFNPGGLRQKNVLNPLEEGMSIMLPSEDLVRPVISLFARLFETMGSL